MVKNGTRSDLIQKLFELLERHRSAFGQERVYWRVIGLVLGNSPVLGDTPSYNF